MKSTSKETGPKLCPIDKCANSYLFLFGVKGEVGRRSRHSPPSRAYRRREVRVRSSSSLSSKWEGPTEMEWSILHPLSHFYFVSTGSMREEIQSEFVSCWSQKRRFTGKLWANVVFMAKTTITTCSSSSSYSSPNHSVLSETHFPSHKVSRLHRRLETGALSRDRYWARQRDIEILF